MHITGLLAYVGPGPGLTMLGAFVGLLCTIGLAILSLLLWPFRMLMRYIRGDKPIENDPATTATLETPKAASEIPAADSSSTPPVL